MWIQMCVFTTNRVGHNEVIGVCHTGPEAEGLGRDHWNEMLAYPRKPITHWHALGEVKTLLSTQSQNVQSFLEAPECDINPSFVLHLNVLLDSTNVAVTHSDGADRDRSGQCL